MITKPAGSPIVTGTPSLMIAEECWALTIVKARPSRLTVPPMFIGSIWLTPWPPRCMQISNMRDHGRAVFLREPGAVAEMVLVAVGQHDEVDRVQALLEALRELRVAGPERVDQDALAAGREVTGRMAEPGELHRGFSPC